MKVSFSIVNLNSRSNLYNCIKVLPESIPDIAYEITVVDNGSRDQSIQMLREHYPDVRIIKNLRNEGYTKAINLALRESVGDMIVLLNPDTIPQAGAISKMIEYMKSNSKAGICGPKVLNMDGSFQKSCRLFSFLNNYKNVFNSFRICNNYPSRSCNSGHIILYF